MLFKKPFTIKSNNFLKSSERKAVKNLIKNQFANNNLNENDLEEFHSKKFQVALAKIVTYNNINISVYLIDKLPVFFSYEDKLFPTVYWLWKFPKMLPSFVIHEQVAQSLYNNSDLFRPGVLHFYPTDSKFVKNDVTSIVTNSNIASIAVGIAEMDSSNFNTCFEGKSCKVLHRYGDFLCSGFDLSLKPIPPLGLPTEEIPLTDQLTSPESDDINDNEKAINDTEIEPSDTPAIPTEITEKIEVQTELTPAQVDKNLEQAFLAGIKYSKTFKLPMTAGDFYRTQILTQIPDFNIKKSSYKKFRPFLLKMAKEGVITMKEIKTGIDQIECVFRDNPIYSKFYLPPEKRPKVPEEEKPEENITYIDEYLRITSAVSPIFKLGNGTPLTRKDVREGVRKYVLENNCVSDDPGYVKPDANLLKATKTQAPISWEELFEHVCNAMKDCHIVRNTTSAFTSLGTGKIRNVLISVANRIGNKKVTQVENLDQFKINLQEFAKDCQRGVGASSTINFPKGGKYEQVQVQGNQVNFVYDLLIEKYKVPKKYIKGLENAPKSKKKK